MEGNALALDKLDVWQREEVVLIRAKKLDGCCSAIDALEKYNKFLWLVNHKFKSKCENQRASLAAYKETLISFNQRTEKAEDQAQELH